MPLNKFVPLSPDPYITSDPEMTLAKFGHLNTIVDYLNGTNALTNIKIAGINNTAGYIDFSANPTGSTTVVGAIRTYVNGVNLSEVMEFREDGNIKVGGILSVGNYANSTGFGQKIRVIGQGDASLGIYRNQASTSAAKLEFMKSRGTYDTPVVVNANDLIGSVGFFGYNGTSYSNAAYIASAALSTSATGVEGDVRFILYNNTGGNYNPMRITKEGVGIGNALDYIPTATLQVRGSGSSSATTSLLVQNSSGTETFLIRDDAAVKIGAGFFGHPSLTRFQVNDISGNAVMRLDSATLSTPTNITNLGTSNLTISGNAILNLLGANGNIGYVNIGGNITNSVAYTNDSRDFVLLNQNWNAVVGSSNLTRNAITLNNNINFTNSTGTNTARGLYINPTLTSVTNYFAIQSVFGGAYFNTSTPQASAVLQADSTTQGFLPPRLTTAQKNLIATPATGLQVHDTDLNRPCFYSGSAWVTL
jgi:hypothetical protein